MLHTGLQADSASSKLSYRIGQEQAILTLNKLSRLLLES
jgi:hypothetical protein